MTTVKVYPTVVSALRACDGCDEVTIVHPEATAIEGVRAIVEAVKYRSARGGAKALVLHPARLSRGGLNALIKTLEDPPAHVRFLFVAFEVPEPLRKWVAP